MKPTHISMVMFLVCLLVSSVVAAQVAEAGNQNRAAALPSAAEVPRLIKFSGALRDAQEQPLPGPVGVTFALYAQQSGGAALWMETQNVKPDANGNYAVFLGASSANGVPAELFDSGEARWLGIQVGQQPEHERILLVSVPYALKARDADTLGGLPASAFLLAQPSRIASSAAGTTPANGTATTTKTAETGTKSSAGVTPAAGAIATNYIPVFTNSTGTLGSSAMYQIGSNIGVGTTTPTVAMDVVGSNAGLRLSGTGTHQVTMTGATSGRLGQDAGGFFFASDTNGKSVRFLTNSGALNERMRITSAGDVGIGTTAPAAKLHVVGNLQLQDGTQGVGKVLASDANGLASWKVLSGAVTSIAGYGDGSSGPLVISGTVDWTQNPPSSTNLQFTNVLVQPGAVWTIPSGLTIRTVGDFQVDGTVIVTTGPTELLYGDTIPVGISASAPDQQGLGGKGITPLQASQILRPGIVGGSEGAPCGNPVGGAGGGTLVLRVGGNFNVSGSIQAKGADGPVCSSIFAGGTVSEGSGGGGGGFILVAVQLNVNVTGNIDISGGNGGNGTDASAQDQGVNGSGGGGGVLHVITPAAPTNLGFTSNGGTAGSGSLSLITFGGGSSGGDGGGSSGSGAVNGKNGFLIVTLAPQPGFLLQ